MFRYDIFLIRLFVFLLGISLLATACTDTSDETGMALVNFRLIDAPGDYDQAWIEFEGVEIFRSNDRQATEGEWIYVPYDQADRQVEVSKLVNEAALLLGRREVPVGGIFKIRLMLGDEHYLQKNGKDRSLTLASPEKAAVEMDVNFMLERNLSYDIYLDVDLERSIKVTADSTKYILDPKVRSFVSNERSIVKGKIQPATAKPVIYAIQNGDTVTTLSDSQGNFSLRGLQPGAHTVKILPLEPHQDTTFSVSTEKAEIIILENIVLKLPPTNNQ
ncbi:MAG TPA: DUF4382 domain-containing protein [Cyclobacteriaceae bacterium]|nr:DUF4382 domain-containing protein [Cyclobacteriaceae bacterium]